MRRLSDEAVSPVIGFVVAALVFSVTFYYVVETAVQTQGDTSGADESHLTKNAESLARVVMGRGAGWFSDEACVLGIEQTVNGDTIDEEGRFGLGAEACDSGGDSDSALGRLDYYKLKNLYTAKKTETANGYADYDEARESLGLSDQGLDFHIRSWPVLASVRSVLDRGYGDPNLRPAYLGNYVGGEGAPARPDITKTARVDDMGDYALLKVSITNLAGSPASQFMVSFSVDLKRGAITWNQNTPILVGGGASYDVTTKIVKTEDWDWGTKARKFTYTVQDTIDELPSPDGEGESDFTDPDTGTPIDMSDHGSERTIVVINTDRLAYELNDAPPAFGGSNHWPSAEYEGFDGEGRVENGFRPNEAENGYTVRVHGGTLDQTYASLGGSSEDLAQGTYVAGTYTVEIKKGGVVLNDDVFEIEPAGGACNVAPGDFEPHPGVLTEAGYMARLFSNFDKKVIHDDYTTPELLADSVTGDVYPDVKCALDSVIQAKFTYVDGSGNRVGKVGGPDDYSTLIVGSDVAHNAMTSENVKGSIEKWVKAGGTLVVMGSDAQAVQWLQPLFHAALDSGSGGLFVPDEEHPVLKTPNDLDWDSFNADTDWSYNAGADAKFTHVVKGDNNVDDVLGISNPGAFDKGKVVLSGWRPHALTDDMADTCPPPEEISDEDECQAIYLIHNLVTISFRELYLDYGPPIPVGEATGQQSRIMSVHHPDLGQTVTLRVQVFVFPGSA